MRYPRWVVTVAPASEPVTLTEAKEHLRVSDTASDTLITSLIKVAREHIERTCERALITQTWKALLDAFPTCGDLTVYLPGGLVTAITSVDYTDKDGGAQVLTSPTGYQADLLSEPARLLPPVAVGATGVWPATQWGKANAVQVTYAVGYANAGAVPAPIKAALLLLVGDLFEHREAQVVDGNIVENLAVRRLLLPFRRVVP